MPFACSSTRWSLPMVALLLVAVATTPLAAQNGRLEPAPSVAPPTPAPPPAPAAGSTVPWWVWPLVLFVFCFALGIVAVVAGVGGGVLYVPLVAGFFPFHIDFVRSSGLLIGLAGALAAGPGLIQRGLASLRLVLPCALAASIGSLIGAHVGLAMEGPQVELALGLCMIAVLALMLAARSDEFPAAGRESRLAAWLGLGGAYHEESLGRQVTWNVHRVGLGLVLFVGVGFLGGMFGLGAGWANVPLLNLGMGLPLKMAVAGSVLLISISNATAAWEYLDRGAWLPIMAIPSMLGLMLGTGIGVKLLGRSRPRNVRTVVIAVLAFAALRTILKGLGIWT